MVDGFTYFHGLLGVKFSMSWKNMSDRTMGNLVRGGFGFLLLFIIGVLALCIALGHVEEKTSFGLQLILGCFTTLSGGFAAWAFGNRDDKEPPEKPPGEEPPV